ACLLTKRCRRSCLGDNLLGWISKLEKLCSQPGQFRFLTSTELDLLRWFCFAISQKFVVGMSSSLVKTPRFAKSIIVSKTTCRQWAHYCECNRAECSLMAPGMRCYKQCLGWTPLLWCTRRYLKPWTLPLIWTIC